MQIMIPVLPQFPDFLQARTMLLAEVASQNKFKPATASETALIAPRVPLLLAINLPLDLTRINILAPTTLVAAVRAVPTPIAPTMADTTMVVIMDAAGVATTTTTATTVVPAAAS
jgi:hypothetical protein